MEEQEELTFTPKIKPMVIGRSVLEEEEHEN